MKNKKLKSAAIVVIGCAAFGLLMASRLDFSPGWPRAVISGLAFGVLGIVIVNASILYKRSGETEPK